MPDLKYRLVTRGDFDGLVCAILLSEAGLLKEIKLAEPRDVVNERLSIDGGDILANLPYHDCARLVFDHHISEAIRHRAKPENYVLDPAAPSAARVVYNYLGGRKTFAHAQFAEIMRAVDRCDSGQFTREEVVNPQGWNLLNFIIDPRSGLGRFPDFSISNNELFLDLIGLWPDTDGAKMLANPHVRERMKVYDEHQRLFIEQLRHCTHVVGNIAITDFRDQSEIYAGNRFLVYAQYPSINISVHVMHGNATNQIVFAVGRSIFDRSSSINIGDLMLSFGGGGHARAGTCQVAAENAHMVLHRIIDRILDENHNPG